MVDFTYHGDSFRRQNIGGRQHREISDVCENVDESDQWDGDADAQGKVAVGVLELGGEEVQCVPVNRIKFQTYMFYRAFLIKNNTMFRFEKAALNFE